MGKNLLIMVGIPGSGKSTVANGLKNDIKSGKTLAGLYNIKGRVVIHSLDNYFMVEGEYKFDISKLSSNINKFKNGLEESLLDGVENVIIDNTNLKIEFIEEYIEKAKQYQYTPTLVIMKNGTNIDEHYKRNIHNVPKTVLSKMFLDFENLKKQLDSISINKILMESIECKWSWLHLYKCLYMVQKNLL